MSLEKKTERARLRLACRARDNRACRVWPQGRPRRRAVRSHHAREPRRPPHHPADRLPNQGNVIENLITLCQPCHEYAEAFLNGNRDHEPHERGWSAYTPSALYALIGSSYEIAKTASEAAS